MAQSILTIGHSTRSIDEFINTLKAHDIAEVIDVRTVPRSRRNPQFNRETLPGSLKAVGIDYTHLPELGGFRPVQPESPNSGWKNPSFRGFADYMRSADFESGIQKLVTLAEGNHTAIMCAEAVPWRCHRSLIADALIIRGIQVEHILSQARAQPHKLTPWAEVTPSGLIYPANIET
ncbi:MAG: DUF488 domain-containing protein [Chloroflexi bacterium]|nr:DUF488 domain-containing protein [Chloroflexota bacterium]